MSSSWSIYGIRLPRGTIRYIGSTQGSIEKRLDAHRDRAHNKPDTKLHQWMARVGPYRVEVVQIEAVPAGDPDALDAAESGWIALYRDSGHALLNMNGGGSGHSHDPAAQQARRDKLSGEKHWNYGKTVPEATKQLISDRIHERLAAGLMKQPPLTDEQRKAVSERASLTNHKRWHVGREVIKDDCVHCPTTDTSVHARA